MKIRPRYLLAQITRDSARKMVFVAGPRQVGKTTLARSLPGAAAGYMNWDNGEHRSRILAGELPSSKLWIFDEIHKYRRWRNYLKGIYDTRRSGQRILVAGSGRLDLYRFGGDSLQGRYHMLRLHPLSVAELGVESNNDFMSLLKLGGFPEPYFGGSEMEARRWSREYRSRLVHEDVQSLERVQDMEHLELLMMRLPDLVGSPLSINALREDLQVSHKAVSNWLMILERLYAVFLLSSFGSPRIRAVKKEQKHYQFDWSLVGNEGARFENMVACHLLKWVHYQQDTMGRDVELRYFRDSDGREVDFVVTEGNKPTMLIECKWSDVDTDKGIKYRHAKFPQADAWQISAIGKKDFVTSDGLRVAR
ncbi:MAG: ATP-binding protein [Steroidobacter sp.]